MTLSRKQYREMTRIARILSNADQGTPTFGVREYEDSVSIGWSAAHDEGYSSWSYSICPTETEGEYLVDYENHGRDCDGPSGRYESFLVRFRTKAKRTYPGPISAAATRGRFRANKLHIRPLRSRQYDRFAEAAGY